MQRYREFSHSLSEGTVAKGCFLKAREDTDENADPDMLLSQGVFWKKIGKGSFSTSSPSDLRSLAVQVKELRVFFAVKVPK